MLHTPYPTSLQVWEGDGVVKSARKLIGATNPLEAEAGTIRGDFAIQTGRNVVHGSDSPENGMREASKHKCTPARSNANTNAGAVYDPAQWLVLALKAMATLFSVCLGVTGVHLCRAMVWR